MGKKKKAGLPGSHRLGESLRRWRYLGEIDRLRAVGENFRNVDEKGKLSVEEYPKSVLGSKTNGLLRR